MRSEFTADQLKADRLIKDWFFHSERQIFVLAGYAGTGKTTLLRQSVYRFNTGRNTCNHSAPTYLPIDNRRKRNRT